VYIGGVTADAFEKLAAAREVGVGVETYQKSHRHIDSQLKRCG
jgi:hypothetical protein